MSSNRPRYPKIRPMFSFGFGRLCGLNAQKPEPSLTLSVGLFLGMIAETYNYNEVRHADVSVPPCTEPLPYAFLDPFFGRFGKTSRRDVLRILENGAASIPNERKLHREMRTPIANCKMKPNTEPIVQRQPAIHRLRQETRHVLQDGVIVSIQVTTLVGNQLCDFIGSERSFIYLVARDGEP